MRPAAHLAQFDGVLQVDGYDGFKRLAGERADQSVRLAFCWVHMRRAFFQFHASTEVAARGRGAGPCRQPLCDRGGDPRHNPPNIDARCDRPEVDRSWRPCMTGCRNR